MTTLSAPQQTATSTWTIDPAHSDVEFAVKHMMVSTVKGRFRAFAGTLEIDEAQPERSRVTAEIEVASVDTGAEQRDAHLRSDDFFNAERFPKISFRSTGLELVEGGRWRLDGELTIRETTRPITLEVEFEGRGRDANGGERAGFTATARINRRDYGVNWNGLIETGGVVVSDVVRINLNIQVVRQG